MVRKSLISPSADFWLVGGLSCVGLLVAWIISDVLPTNRAPLIVLMASWAFYAAFFVNFPHFAYSYQLFYSSYFERLRDNTVHWHAKTRVLIAGVVVPVLMFDYFTMTYALKSKQMLGWAVLAMFVSVGWHYVKQGYGVFITLSVYKKIFYQAWEKRILLTNAYVVWIYVLLKFNTAVYEHNYYDVPYKTFGLPSWLLTAFSSVAVATTILSALVLLKIWLKDRRGISINGITGYVASLYLWLIFPHINPVFVLFVPMFHSLQYLPFVFRYKTSEFNEKESHDAPLKRWLNSPASFALIGLILGGGFMYFIPLTFDKIHNTSQYFFTKNYFMVSILLFINIHHYFIDSSFWRRDNKRVQDYLFNAK